MPAVPTVLRRLPYFDTTRTLSVRGLLAVTVKPHQIVVWVSLSPPEWEELPGNAPYVPAILDIGLAHNFSIQLAQLYQWAGIHPESLETLGHVRMRTGRRRSADDERTPPGEELQQLPLLDAKPWLLPNRPGTHEVAAGLPAFPIELDEGIIVYPAGFPNPPRLPLLGLRAFHRAGLQLFIDSARREVFLRTPTWLSTRLGIYRFR